MSSKIPATALLLICIGAQLQRTSTQNPFPFENRTPSRIHVTKCAEYKRAAYETEYEYGPLLLNSPSFTRVVDLCKMPTRLIVDGIAAEAKEFPHMARLGNSTDGQAPIWFCGGTLLSTRYVLTAAHCFYSPQGSVNIVRLGELNFNTDDDDAQPEDFRVQRTIPHPKYVDTLNYNDIGLVELSREVTLSPYVAPACLPIGDGDEYNSYVAVGWGATKQAGPSSDVLFKVQLRRFSLFSCGQVAEEGDRLPTGLNERSQMCAGSSDKKDTCHGDSGGPLLQYHPGYDCMYYLLGITSVGVGCGTPDVPGIYTRVFNYVDWIEGIVWG